MAPAFLMSISLHLGIMRVMKMMVRPAHNCNMPIIPPSAAWGREKIRSLPNHLAHKCRERIIRAALTSILVTWLLREDNKSLTTLSKSRRIANDVKEEARDGNEIY